MTPTRPYEHFVRRRLLLAPRPTDAHLLAVVAPESESRRKEARLFVTYKLALKLLIEIKLLEKDTANKTKIAGTPCSQPSVCLRLSPS